VVDADAFVIVGRVPRGPRALIPLALVGMGFAAVVLFVAGLFPAYDWEREGGFPDPAGRCPESIPSEQGYDGGCVLNLIEHGPIYLGKELLAASFVFGAGVLFGAFRLDLRSVTWLGALLLVCPFFVIGYPLAFWRRDGALIQAVYLVGLLATVGAFALVWIWNRRAVVVLSIVYIAAWIGLLAWNAERALHFLGET
jgi:hypothetical protein